MAKTQTISKRLGILVGGGPAPGINAVIGAATIEACNQGFQVVGLYDGFLWLSSEAFDVDLHTTGLEISTVSRIHFEGGSILRTSRANLAAPPGLADRMGGLDPEKVRRILHNLDRLAISHLVTIGGDGTAHVARILGQESGGRIRLVHVPKTIDNDLPLPHDIPTFGFTSALHHGTQIVKNLMQDARTTARWYLVTSMGRSAGWLALAIGHAVGATLTLIPEEFTAFTRLSNIVDVLEGAILKRRVMGRPDGVAVVAEGLAYRLGDKEELERLLGKEVTVDPAGHLRLAEFPLAELLRQELQSRFKSRGEKLTLVTHALGYELRSADPTAFDMGYCRSLGHGSIRLLLDTERVPNGVMVTLVNGNLVPVCLDDMMNPSTGRTSIRVVDVKSDYYRVARAYMIRLERADLSDAELLSALSAEAGLSPDEFKSRYLRAATRLVDGVPAE